MAVLEYIEGNKKNTSIMVKTIALFSIKYLNNLLLTWLIFFFFQACENKPSRVLVTDTANTGTIVISVDESFKPIIDQQIKVFEASNPAAHIKVQYKPEAACLKDLTADSIRMVIITRPLSNEEATVLHTKISFQPVQNKLAYDAVAMIVNKASADSLFSMEEVRSLVKGTSGYKYKILLDGLSATSTVRYVSDSIAKGMPLGSNVVAATSSEAVINYVSENTDAIGMIGVSWIGNTDDTNQASFLEKVKIVGIECAGCNPVVYTKPFQYNIATRRYPMVRSLYYVLKENFSGLGSGLADFMLYERGQLIFKRAYLWPAKMSFVQRGASIK
jgi:phosphate transport system substrate-binding protein